MPGYIWDPKNGAVPESSPAPVEKKRKGLLSIPTTQNVMPGSASSAAAFSQYIPRVNSTVGSDLAYAGSLLATPMLGVGTKAAANVLELTSPSHWVSKAAARLALPTEKALKYGRVADIVVPATVSGLGVGKGFVDLSRAEMSKEKENAWKEIAGSGAGLFAGLLAAPVGNSIVRRIRKVKNLARLDNAGTIGGLDDVGKNLAEYNAAIGERPAVLDRMKRTKINTRVKPNSAEAMASYGRDPNNFGNIVKINPESSAWGLGPEYADALIAHEAEHAVLDAYGPVQFYPEQVTRRPQLQVPDGMKFAPNTNNPLYGELKVLSDANNGIPWYSNPEEVAAETAFLRQLTGQNKNYTELPGFYQKRFRNYIGDQFSLMEPEAHQVLSSLSGKYDYGGLIDRLQKHYGSNEKALEAVRKFAGGGPIGDGEELVGPPVPYSLIPAGDIPMPDYNIFEDENSFKKRDAHLKSLDAFIAANPTIAGLNTADFRDVLSQFAGLESSYNSKASNKSGYSGYYGLEGGSSLSDNAQHRKAYEHLASLFKHNITRDDVQKGIDMGYTPAQILYKYWNQQNNATEFLQNGSAETIGNNPELGLMGNNINAIADYYKYIPEAIMDDFHVVKSGDNFSTIQERVRKPGRHYNQAGKDLKQWNSDAVVNGKLKIGDKVWFTEPYAEGGFLKDYRSGGNLFRPGGIKRRVSEFMGGILTPEEVGVIMKHPTDYIDYLGWDDDKIGELKQNFYDNFFPWGYDILAGMDAMRGGAGQKRPIGVHDKEAYARDYLLAEYLGIPEEKRKSEKSKEIFEESGYRPSMGDEEGERYVRFSTPYHRNKAVEIYNGLLSNVVNLPGKKNMKPGRSYQSKVGEHTYRITPGKSGSNYAVAQTDSYQFDVDPYSSALGQYTIGSGVDPERGQYISVYDKWDLNPFSQGATYPLPRKFVNTIASIEDASGGVGHPVKYYDRIYLDDYYSVSSRPEPGALYGGYLLPAEISASRELKSGGKIHIKPENRGKFTALKKRTGHSASWFKAHGTPAQKKMATFALNSRKWKHGDGGIIDRLYNHSGGDVDKMLELIQKARSE